MGLPDKSILIMITSLAESTMKQYELPLRLWWQYGLDEMISWFDVDIEHDYEKVIWRNFCFKDLESQIRIYLGYFFSSGLFKNILSQR